MGETGTAPAFIVLLLEFHINGRRKSAEPIPVLIFAKKSLCPSIDYTLSDNPNNKKKAV
jgi:hypothetical protein